MFYDLYEVLRTVFRWTTVSRGLLFVFELIVVARVGMAVGKRCKRHHRLKWATALAVLGVIWWCTADFFQTLQEDYAYVVLGGESEYYVPYAMRWLVKQGGKRRLVRTVCSPVDAEDIEMRNTRLYAAMVLAKKDPEGSRKILARVSPFDKPCCGNPDYVFGTNRYSWPVAGADVLQMKWNDGTNHIPYEWKTRVAAW